jgi:hypothetical protein
VTLPSVAITVPTWKRGEMFRKCVESLLSQDYAGHIEIMCVVDYEEPERVTPQSGQPYFPGYDKPTDLGVAQRLREIATSCGFAGLRSVRIKRGPGRSNWRPGAIHFPVFEHWLQTKCDYVSYQFSDEYSGPERISRQIRAMVNLEAQWSYCSEVEIINASGDKVGHNRYTFHRKKVPSNHLMTPTILVNRSSFESVGGLDFPLHAAAKAEEWIQTHCALIGQPVGQGDYDNYYFRVHEESLGHGQKPGSAAYQQGIAETGWVEEDHWRLWNRIAPIYQERINKVHERT